MRIACWLLVVAFFSQATTAWTATTAGIIRDPEHIVVSGATTFTAEDITETLSLNSEFQSATDSATSIDDYLKTIDRLICVGYRHMGFPNVESTVSQDEKTQAVVVKVKEGSRYLAGEIRVDGAKSIPIAQLVERFTTPYPPKDAIAHSFRECGEKIIVDWADSDGKAVNLCDPVWCTDKPAEFPAMPEADSRLHSEVAEALADLGYLFAQFSVAVVTDPATKRAQLVVDISDEGVRTLIDNVEIVGNKANSREDILKYVEFEPNTPATRDEQVRLQSKLWHSGRFIKSTVTPIHPASAGETASLRIDLIELDDVTPLCKPLSTDEAFLLKCRNQMANMARWDGDLVLQTSGSQGSGTIVSSPTDGMLVGFTCAGISTQKPAEYAIIFSPEEIGFYNVSDGRSFATRSISRQLVGSVALYLSDNANNEDEGRRLSAFGFGIRSDSVHSKAPLDLALTFDPAYFVDMAHRPDMKRTVQDGILTMSTADETLRFDAESGKLLEHVVTVFDDDDSKDIQPIDTNAADASPASNSPNVTRVSFVCGELRRRLDAIHAATATALDGSQRPFSSLLTFVCEEERLSQWLGIPEDQRVRQLVRQMLDQNVFEPFDKLVCKFFAAGERDSFSIPERAVPQQPMDQAYSQYAAFVLYAVHKSFRPGSWPDVVGRDAFMTMLGHGKSVEAELKKTYESDKSGPFCFLVTGGLLVTLDPPVAKLMTARGLQRLSLDDFRKEYPVFLDSQCPTGQCVHRIAAFLRKLDDKDVQSLSVLLPAEPGAAIRAWVEDQRANPEQPIDQALPKLLDALWASGLRECVETAFTMLQGYSDYFIYQSAADKTISGATGAICLDPQSAEMHSIRARAYASKDEYDKAIADYTEALKLDPKAGWTYYNRGCVYVGKRDFANAIADYSEAIRLDSQWLEKCYVARAYAHQLTYEYNKAIADYTEAIRLDPKDASAFYNRGAIYKWMGEQNIGTTERQTESKGAVTAFEIAPNFLMAAGEASKSSPTNSNESAAFRIVREVNFDKAIADLTEAIRLNPTFTEAYQARSSIYKEKGDTSQAEADMAEANKLETTLK